ncbi:MAG: TldD/PmbA family protein [Actinobacteria bacterium]|nr:TldD/PmbA family protein [Actinomycetota bacterium]
MSELKMSAAVEIGLELLGTDGGVVVGEVSQGANLRWANSQLTTNGDIFETSLNIVAFVPVSGGIGAGVASGQVRTRDDIAKLVQVARASGVASGASEDAAELVAGPVSSDFGADPAVADLSGINHIAAGLGDVMQDQTAQFFGYAEHSQDTLYVGTSAGTRLRFAQATSRFELCAKSPERDRSAWSGQGGTSLLSTNVHEHAKNVLQGLEYQKTKIDIEPGRHKVTLSASAVADLMIYLMWTASAREAAQGRSVFSAANGKTRVGEQLTSRDFNLISDPKLSGLATLDSVVSLGASSMSSPFDTGLPIAATNLISGGVLTALASSRHAASEAGLPFTALADNIYVYDGAGHGSLAETAARMGDGLLITCLWYIREVDPQSLLLTGLTRDGVYVVREGEIVGAAGNFRFNDSPVSLLDRITDAGDSLDCLPREWADWFSRSRVAPLAIDGFNLSTKSDAI